MDKLQDKVVVVTGGSAGVGRAAAEAFARRGAKVAVLARGRERLESAVQDLKRLGAPEAMSVQVDVADPQQVENAAQQVEGGLGPIDIWINDAMTTVFSPIQPLGAGEGGLWRPWPLRYTCPGRQCTDVGGGAHRLVQSSGDSPDTGACRRRRGGNPIDVPGRVARARSEAVVLLRTLTVFGCRPPGRPSTFSSQPIDPIPLAPSAHG